MINEPLGWILISLGFLAGAFLGTRYQDEQFLGGYADPKRRLVRLGHIACIALGVLNLLFVLSAERAGMDGLALAIASWGFVVGGVAMPTICFLSSWRRGFGVLFAVPVLSLVAAGGLTAWGVAS